MYASAVKITSNKVNNEGIITDCEAHLNYKL